MDHTRGVGRHVETEHARTHLISYGAADRPPLVLLHGIRDQGRSWDQVATALSRDYHVIAIDLWGHGDSDRLASGIYTNAAWVLQLHDVLEQLQFDSIGLVGHSLGGNIALRYASAFPQRVWALVCIEGIEMPLVRRQREDPKMFPALMAEWMDEERASSRRRPRLYASLEEGERRMAESHPRLPHALLAQLTRDGMRLRGDGRWEWKYDNAARVRAPEDADGHLLDQMLEAITAPALLCYGTKSWIAPPPPERLARLKYKRIATFEGAGHWLHHEQVDPFTRQITKFFKRTCPALNQGSVNA